MENLAKSHSNKDIYLYVIQLRSNKIFVYSSLDKDIETVSLEMEIYSDFVKMYKPQHLLEKKLLMDPYDVDKMVKYYMYYYGIVNVRGGSYTDIDLSNDCENILTKELDYIDRTELNKHDEIKIVIEAADKYKNVENLDINEPYINETHIKSLKKNLEKYEKETHVLNTIKYFYKDGIKIFITTGLLNEVVWLSNEVDQIIQTCSQLIEIKPYSTLHPVVFTDKREPKETIDKYLNILYIFKQIYSIYYITNPIYKQYSLPENCIKHTEFILDDFFFHKDCIHLSKSKENVLELCKIYKTYILTIINRIEEYEYDVSSWEYNYKWRTNQIIYLLERNKKLTL